MAENLRKPLDCIVLLLFALICLFFLYGVATGLPISIGEWTYRAKNFKGLVLIGLGFWAVHLALHPQGPKEGILQFKRSAEQALRHKASVWILFIVFGLLFTWQQVAEYLAIEINFLPFSFYDYMLYYFFHGKIHFTGWLHGYYHHNIIMFLLAPFWKLFQSPLLLVLSYGLIASACIFPLYAIAKERFKDALVPFVIALIFLNYRYLQNVLLMNFSVEICYPLFIFSAVYFSMKRKWGLYYLFLVLELFVKEDSFVYGMIIGLLTFFYRDEQNSKSAAHRWHGVISVLLSMAYYVFLRTVYSPLIGSDIMFGNSANYAGHGGSFSKMVLMFLGSPWLLFAAFFGSKLKVGVLSKVLSRVAFLPLFSPALILMLIALAPLFLHNTGRDNDFIELRFHYAAAILPFIFIGTVFGFSNLLRKMPARWNDAARWGFCLLMIVLNVGAFHIERFTAEDLKSIAWAKAVPPGVLLTHGHLLPYAGYREQNFYFAEPFMDPGHPAHQAYSEPDFVLIDMNVNLYPMNRAFFEREISKLKRDQTFELVKQDRDMRYLFKRVVSRTTPLPVPGYKPLNELVKPLGSENVA